MEFTILERIVLMNVLPQEENYLTYKIIKDLKFELAPSEKETKEYEIVERDGRVFWNPQKEKPKRIEIGEKAREVISKALKKLDEEGKINDQNASLYEKFVLSIK